MLKRAWISTIKNRARTTILVILLFVIANLVLSSISIKSATNETMDIARASLDPEITLQVDRESVLSYVRSIMIETGQRPDMSTVEEMMGTITSETAYLLAESEYVVDYNFSIETRAQAVDFVPIETEYVDNKFESDDSLDWETSVSIVGTNNPFLLDSFSNEINVLTGGSNTFTGVDNNVVIMSYDLAFDNNLDIGDSITIEDPETVTEMTFEIIGLYQNDESLTGSISSTSNTLFIPLNDTLTLTGQSVDDDFEVSSATYFLDDPLNVNYFIESSTNMVPEIENGELSFNDTNYDSITEPIQQVGSFTDIVLIVVVFASVVILTLLIVNTLKDRKYEIGVLLSLGEQKAKISIQYVLELLLIASLAFTISIFSANYVSSYLGDEILSMQIENIEEDNSSPIGIGRMGGGLTQVTSDVDYIEELNVSVSLNDFVITLSIGAGIIIFSSILPSLYITRFQPKKIFSSRN